ncbi:MAG TPA: hypothetical protein VGF94_29925 [Kofleriaceae bacterium]|jgi:hypothetical protein
MQARVVNGRWVLEDPTGLPEGTVVEIVTHAVTADVYVDERIRQYAHALVVAACSAKHAGQPRSLDLRDEKELVDRAIARAKQEQRTYVTPTDVKHTASDTLRKLVGQASSVAAILDETAVP